MANFGSFEYGTSVVYGPTSTASQIDAVDVLDKNVIQVEFTGNVVIDENLLDPENYAIEFSDNLGFTDVTVKKVRPHQTSTALHIEESAHRKDRVTTRVELVTDYHTPGQGYRITVDNIKSSEGTTIATTSVDAIARRTKVELILKNLPKMYDKRPGSTIRALSVAMGIEDDRIGGSLNEEIPS